MKTKNSFNLANNDFHLLREYIGYPLPESICCSREIIKFINSFDEEPKIPSDLFLAGLKFMEIVEDLNLPLETVKSRIFFTSKN